MYLFGLRVLLPIETVKYHLAVVIDGRVEEVLRAENRLAALLMSKPEIIQFEPHIVKPTIGWGYDGEKFLIPEEMHDHEH